MGLTVEIGSELPVIVKVPNEVALFSYSAATWNQHRIHYDRDHAVSEGYRDLVVQGNLQGEWLVEVLGKWLGTWGRIRQLRYRNVRVAYVNQTYTVRGVVTDIQESPGDGVYDITCDLWVDGIEGTTTTGSAVLEVPTVCIEAPDRSKVIN